MSDDTERERWEEIGASPFEPDRTRPHQGTDIDARLRIVRALEYIAAQLGEIRRRLDADQPTLPP